MGPVNSARDPLKVLKHTFSKKKKEKKKKKRENADIGNV